MPSIDDFQSPQLYAVVELFGHARIAGAINEQAFGGTAFIRVDVPAVTVRESEFRNGERVVSIREIAAHTRSFGAAAIYSINWCDEATAQVAAFDIKHEPMKPYSVKEAINNLPDADRHRLLTSHREIDNDQPF